MRVRKTCTPCIKRKVRCSHTIPCSECIRTARTSRCVYEENQTGILRTNDIPHTTVMSYGTKTNIGNSYDVTTANQAEDYRPQWSQTSVHPKSLVDPFRRTQSDHGLYLPPISCLLNLPAPASRAGINERRGLPSSIYPRVQVPQHSIETSTTPARMERVETAAFETTHSNESHTTLRLTKPQEQQRSMIVSSSNQDLVVRRQGRLWEKSIVQELRFLKTQRVAWRNSIAAQRRTMPSISALRRRAEEARVEELETARVAKEARRKAEVERSKVQDAVEQESNLRACELGLSQNRHRSYTLMHQLGIDLNDQYPSKRMTKLI
jgi:hypothetical protein